VASGKDRRADLAPYLALRAGFVLEEPPKGGIAVEPELPYESVEG